MPEAAISRPFDFRLALSLPLTLMTVYCCSIQNVSILR